MESRAEHASKRPADVADAYRAAWAVREFGGAMDESTLQGILRSANLDATWVEDQRGWALIWGLWQADVAPDDAARALHRHAQGRHLRSL